MKLRLFCVLIFIHSLSYAAKVLYVPVQFIIENGDYSGSLVALKKDGQSIFSVAGEKNLRLKLDFNENYLIAFSKPGYITKQISVNTSVPEERIQTGFDPYKIGVRLYKQYEGINIVVYNQPVASIRFLASLDDFGYDTDYTKSILSLLTETENKLAARAESERKQQKFKAGDADKSADRLPGSSDNVNVLPKTQIVLKEDPELTPANPADNPIRSPENTEGNNIAPQTGIDLNKNPSGNAGNDSSTDLPAAYGNNSPPATIPGNAGENKEIKSETVITGADEPVAEVNVLHSYSKTSETVYEPHRVITTVRIVKQGQTNYYHKVKYLNGDCYYFMQGDKAITMHLYEYFTGENGTQIKDSSR